MQLSQLFSHELAMQNWSKFLVDTFPNVFHTLNRIQWYQMNQMKIVTHGRSISLFFPMEGIHFASPKLQHQQIPLLFLDDKWFNLTTIFWITKDLIWQLFPVILFLKNLTLFRQWQTTVKFSCLLIQIFKTFQILASRKRPRTRPRPFFDLSFLTSSD